MSRGVFAGMVELLGVGTLVGALFVISWPFAVAAIGIFLIVAALVIQKGGY
jgi:glycerol-3-phosphate acyltransferase PlsY